MAELMLVNPKRRKKRATSKAVAKRKPRKRAAAKMPTKRRRRNPAARKSGIMAQVQGAAVGAAGALAVDVAMSKLPIPATMTSTPTMMAATQGAVSIGLGMLVANFGKKRALGRQLAEGGLTVALHAVGKSMIGPSVGLSSYDPLLGYQDTDLLGYEDLGWYSPAATSEAPSF